MENLKTHKLIKQINIKCQFEDLNKNIILCEVHNLFFFFFFFFFKENNKLVTYLSLCEFVNEIGDQNEENLNKI